MTAGFGVWAGLNATAFNTSPQSVTSGKLSLGLTDNGAGFTTAITNIAPGDTVNRFVDVTNNGNLAAQGLTLAVSAASNNALITDGTGGSTTKALRVSVDACSTSWDPTGNSCTSSGTVTNLLAATPLSGLSSAQSLIAGSIAVSATEHLRVQMTLPDQTETTTNGSLPTNTIQNLSASLTYTFQEAQRTGTTTSS
jgi:hypothetical protein